MFKYVKTIGSHASVPEIEEMFMDAPDTVPAGTVLFHDGTSLSMMAKTSDQDEPKYFLTEKYEYKTGPHAVKAFRIKCGMLFCVDETLNYEIGSTHLLGANSNNTGYDKVLSETGHGARIAMNPYNTKRTFVELEW